MAADLSSKQSIIQQITNVCFYVGVKVILSSLLHYWYYFQS